ncbi:MAG: F0F1 ATP synthase subunit delta [Minisyncoccales bacterium]
MNSKKTIKIWTMVLVKECAGKTAVEQKKIILRLKEILKSKKRGYLLRRIVRDALNAMKKQARFEITMAHSQSAEAVGKLKNRLAVRFGGDEDADVDIDPAIIGGFVAKTDHYLIDASVKGFLKQLKKSYQ